MKKLVLIVAVACASCAAPQTATKDQPAAQASAAAEQRAQGITIARDDWGIAHVHGKTDADAVFGAIYAQAEDDFNRIETNYMDSLGRRAEDEGEAAVYRDLRMKLFIDPDDMKAKYQQSPDWLKKLMDAWADGLNYYLAKHPNVHPKVIRHFEPWMALSFTEGSIGGDIERVNLKELEAFYGQGPKPVTRLEEPLRDTEPRGSNGIAIGPSITATHHAMLLINPHTSFFFRSELQMTSDEGLDAYGASTWGQFFIYQGFNERAGWMHTSSGVDNIDEFLETITKKGDGFVYKYGSEERPVKTKKITVPYKTSGGMATKDFTVYYTHHGPVVREQDGKWVTVSLMQEPIKALTQSYNRTKAHDLAEYEKVMDLHTNSSNNTLFADADGNFALFYSNFVPKRDPKFDYTKPVDGSDPATDWHGLLSFDESPNVVNPPNGWVYNTNNAPWSAAGPNSPKPANFPKYIERGGENPRGLHAIRVLSNRKDFTLDGLIAAAFDSYETEFAILIPRLLKAYDQTPASNPLKQKVADQIAALRKWDDRWGVDSVPTTVAVYWGEDLWDRIAPDAKKAGVSNYEYMETKATPQQQLESLAAASDRLTADFGKWQTPWGDVNRFQRIDDSIVAHFDDSKPSTPVGFTSAKWGSLASFGARTYPNTKKMYGTSGNSFVAVVEFGGDRVHAKAVTAGGESGDPQSKHFNDQAGRYATGNLREVYYYPDQLKGHTERTYHPGQP